MSIEHAALTGTQVHEPKFIELADAGDVYLADGSGSGSWGNPTSSILNLNKYYLQSRMDDLAAASSTWFHIPIKSKLTRLNVMIYGAVDADTVLSVYINGVLFADSLTIVAAGSAAGQRKNVTIATDNSIAAGSIIEIRSNGAATASVRGDIQLEMLAIV